MTKTKNGVAALEADTVCDNDVYEKFTEEDYKSVFTETSKIIPVKKEEDLSDDDYNIIFTETSKIISEKKEKKSVVSLAFGFRAQVYQYWGKYQQAISDYSSAIELDNRIESAFYNRGGVFYTLKMYKEALLDFKKAYEIKPDDKDALAWIEYLKKGGAGG